MRDVNRIPAVLQEVEKLWRKYPDMRFGQLMGNVLGEYCNQTNRDYFFMEDDKFVEFIQDIWTVKKNG